MHEPQVLRAQNITTKFFKNILILCGITDIQTMYKINRFHLAVRVFSDNVQRTSKRGNVVAFLCSYHVLTSSVRYKVHTHGQMESIY